MKIEDMNRDEQSLLIYFETVAVDYGGLVESRRMNATDFEIADQWDKTGFVRFGRLYSKDIKTTPGTGTRFDHWSVLSDEAWVEAHRARRARAKRAERNLQVDRNGYEEVAE